LCYKSFLEHKEPEPVVSASVESKVLKEEVKTPENVAVKSNKRCHDCGRKVGIYGFKCKCSGNFCSRHRHPEQHKCTYDFRAEQLKKLAVENLKSLL